MNSKRIRTVAFMVTLGLGSVVLQGCPLGGLLNDCYGEGTISRSAYDDLSAIERVTYEENSCGRYVRRSDWLGDLGDLFD